MSADNFLAIRHKNKTWVVMDGNASTDEEWPRDEYKTRDEAIDAAQEIMQSEVVEYGISVIEKEDKDSTTEVLGKHKDVNKFIAKHRCQKLIYKHREMKSDLVNLIAQQRKELLEEVIKVDYPALRRKLVNTLQSDEDFDFVVRKETIDKIMDVFVSSKIKETE